MRGRLRLNDTSMSSEGFLRRSGRDSKAVAIFGQKKLSHFEWMDEVDCWFEELYTWKRESWIRTLGILRGCVCWEIHI